jgi:prepilin-type N-terminal cleavage/methylation domain-containing protein
MKLKKAFTLIELLITLFLSSILLWFAFSYQFNFLKEMRYLEDQEHLARETFLTSEYMMKGIVVDDKYISGLIGMKDINNNNYKTHLSGNKQIYLTAASSKMHVVDELTWKEHIFQKIEYNSLNIVKIKDMNNHQNKGIYSFKLNTSFSSFDYTPLVSPELKEYTRLIYTK